MAVEVLVIAANRPVEDSIDRWRKGEPVTVKESPAIWGDMEGLPKFIRITVPDVDYADAQNWEAWLEKHADARTRYYLQSTVVDDIILLGGLVNMTRNQVLAAMADRGKKDRLPVGG